MYLRRFAGCGGGILSLLGVKPIKKLKGWYLIDFNRFLDTSISYHFDIAHYKSNFYPKFPLFYLHQKATTKPVYYDKKLCS